MLAPMKDSFAETFLKMSLISTREVLSAAPDTSQSLNDCHTCMACVHVMLLATAHNLEVDRLGMKGA